MALQIMSLENNIQIKNVKKSISIQVPVYKEMHKIPHWRRKIKLCVEL